MSLVSTLATTRAPTLGLPVQVSDSDYVVLSVTKICDPDEPAPHKNPAYPPHERRVEESKERVFYDQFNSLYLIQLRTASHKDLVKAQNSTYGCLISLVKEPRCDFKTLPAIYIQLLDVHKKLLSSYTGLPFRVSLSSAVESLPHNTHVTWIEANQRFKLSVGSYYYPQAFLIPADVPEPQTLLTALPPHPDAGCRLAKKGNCPF
ncbi:hypothetical protein DFH09DRAFT_1306567 [Mycena vulgaris]|nr:hypothetical protein DFH09DRAFT_1306567 [Mycena vulgaris]